MSMEILDKEKYEKWGRWVAPVLAWELGYRYSKGEVMMALDLDAPMDILVLDGHAFYIKEARTHFNRSIEKHINPIDREYFKQYKKLSEETIDAFLSLLEEEKVRSEDWEGVLKEFFSRYEELWSPWMAAFFVGDFAENQIKQLANRYDLEEEYVLTSVASDRKSFSMKAKEEMLRFKVFAENNRLWAFIEARDFNSIRLANNDFAREIENYICKYEWIGTHHFWGNPYDMDRFFDEIIILKSEREHDIHGDYPDDLQFFIELAGFSSWLRLQCAEASDIVAFHFKGILSKAANAMHMTYDDLIWLSHEEILRGISERQAVVSRIDREERKKSWGARLCPERIDIFAGEELEKLLETFVEKDDNSTSEIKGAVASKGYAKGRVRIVLVPHLIEDFKNGEILVAPETTPDFVPLMNLAQAIITDQGGITSHAAIVSRELGVPCIIGTKIATQVLKDGDLVEVDAEWGIVTILERGPKHH